MNDIDRIDALLEAQQILIACEDALTKHLTFGRYVREFFSRRTQRGFDKTHRAFEYLGTQLSDLFTARGWTYPSL